MNRTLLLTVVLLFLISCAKTNEMKIAITNPSDFDRLEEIVEIPLDSIVGNVKLSDSLVYVVKNEAGEILPSQITYDRKLIFQLNLKAKESQSFTIATDTVQVFPSKVYGRFITERKDDFAWENDRVAYRIYGMALKEIDGPSNGIDAWYKRTNEPIVNKWYKDLSAGISYHDDHGDGLDDYKVGRSLGAGAMAPFVDGKLWLNENFVNEELFDNGPLRVTFKVSYNPLNVNGTEIAENRIISLDAGSQLSKVVQAYTIKEPMKVAAGIVKRDANDSIISGNNYVIYAEPNSKKVDNVYLAIVMPNPIEQTLVDSYEIVNQKTNKKETHQHVLALTTHQPKIPVVYYTGFGWSKFGFETVADFQNYVDRFAVSLQEPLIINYK